MADTITVNTNLSSLVCQKYLNKATTKMDMAMERLTSGFRINSAKDDAAGCAVSTGMEAKLSGYDVIETNTQMGLDMLTTQEGVLNIINDYLQRIRDLTMQAANGTYGSDSMTAIKIEVEQRMEEINRLCAITDFNGTYLIDGSKVGNINLQVGLYSNERCIVTMDEFLFASAQATVIFGFASKYNADGSANPNGCIDLRTSAAYDKDNGYIYRARMVDANGQPILDAQGNIQYLNGYYTSAFAASMAENGTIEYTGGTSASLAAGRSFTVEDICEGLCRNDSSAREFLDLIDHAIDNISFRCTQVGGYLNRLESAVDATGIQQEHLTSANSTLKDSDIAVESSNYIKYQVMQQAAATLLSTANQQPQIALSLL